MPNPEEGLFRIHVMMDREDYEWYRRQFGDTISISKIVQELMKQGRKKLEDRIGIGRAPQPEADILADATRAVIGENSANEG